MGRRITSFGMVPWSADAVPQDPDDVTIRSAIFKMQGKSAVVWEWHLSGGRIEFDVYLMNEDGNGTRQFRGDALEFLSWLLTEECTLADDDDDEGDPDAGGGPVAERATGDDGERERAIIECASFIVGRPIPFK